MTNTDTDRTSAHVRMLERMLASGRQVLAASRTAKERAYAMDSVRRLEIQLAAAKRAAEVG